MRWQTWKDNNRMIMSSLEINKLDPGHETEPSFKDKEWACNEAAFSGLLREAFKMVNSENLHTCPVYEPRTML